MFLYVTCWILFSVVIAVITICASRVLGAPIKERRPPKQYEEVVEERLKQAKLAGDQWVNWGICEVAGLVILKVYSLRACEPRKVLCCHSTMMGDGTSYCTEDYDWVLIKKYILNKDGTSIPVDLA